MKFYSENNEPLTEEEIEKIKQNPKYREKINSDLKSINDTINKLTLDRNKSEKIIGLVIGTEISCFLTFITDTAGITEPNINYSSFRIVLLITSVLIRNINIIKNLGRKAKINILSELKEDILSENEWIDNNQKTLNY